MKLTWRQIEAFRAIMLSGTITRAAEFLNISQPAVSILLANLEHELGYKLFRRQRGRLVTTGEAEALYPEIERAFIGLDEIALVASSIGEMSAGVVRMATIPLFAGPRMYDAVAAFADAHPDVSIVFEVQPRLTLLSWIGTNRCDLGVSIEPSDQPGVVSRAIAVGESVCVLPRGHALARNRVVRPRDLDGERLVSLPAESRSRRQLDQLLQDAKSRPLRRVEARTSQALWQLVERGIGVGVVPDFALSGPLAENVTTRPFEPSFRSEVQLLTARDRPLSRLAAALGEHIAAHCDRLGRRPSRAKRRAAR